MVGDLGGGDDGGRGGDGRGGEIDSQTMERL